MNYEEFEYQNESLFTTIPTSHEFLIASVTAMVGFVLNAVILNVYWDNKSDIAVYIKAFAGFDIFSLAYYLIHRSLLFMYASNYNVGYALAVGFNLIANHTLLGPLYLALDRFLIVTFPHKFHLYERKMKFFKVAIFAVTLISSLGLFFPEITMFFIIVGSFNMLLQILACLGLYMVIVVRVYISARKMGKSRIIGNRCAHVLPKLRPCGRG